MLAERHGATVPGLSTGAIRDWKPSRRFHRHCTCGRTRGLRYSPHASYRLRQTYRHSTNHRRVDRRRSAVDLRCRTWFSRCAGHTRQSDDEFKPEGFGSKAPFISHIVFVPVRQLARALPAECYSSDLQQVNIALRVLYRIPEASVVRIYKEFANDPFDSLIAPRVQEALKEVTALQSAEQIVKKREEIKAKALAATKEKIGSILIVEDIVLENITLSKELEAAIESKMVQEQEAAKARFTQQKSQIEADTAIIKAKGEAEAIASAAKRCATRPASSNLQIVEKWDGEAPLESVAAAAKTPAPISFCPSAHRRWPPPALRAMATANDPPRAAIRPAGRRRAGLSALPAISAGLGFRRTAGRELRYLWWPARRFWPSAFGWPSSSAKNAIESGARAAKIPIGRLGEVASGLSRWS